MWKAHRVSGISHVEVNVSGLAKSIEFWGWLLPQFGFEPYQVWEEGRSYKYADSYLVFVQAEPQFRDDPFHRKRPGLNHIALRADSRQQVRELPRLLRDRGIRLLYEDRSADTIGAPSEWTVFFEDPDRMKVEVVAPED
jgi:catechol 2,3-dioxygenase-like lactoylglutathione lyase family enzyme